MLPTIRFFCSADASALGLLALTYTDAMVSVGFPVRLVARHAAALHTLAQGDKKGVGWVRHRGLFLTPIDGKIYTNVVCGDPIDHRRLYTVGVKNVLLTAYPPPPDAEDLRAAIQYQTIIVHGTRDLLEEWTRVGGRAVVIPLSLQEHVQALRDALT
jgi:hypothetical protein